MFYLSSHFYRSWFQLAEQQCRRLNWAPLYSQGKTTTENMKRHLIDCWSPRTHSGQVQRRGDGAGGSMLPKSCCHFRKCRAEKSENSPCNRQPSSKWKLLFGWVQWTKDLWRYCSNLNSNSFQLKYYRWNNVSRCFWWRINKWSSSHWSIFAKKKCALKLHVYSHALSLASQG